MRFLLTAIQRRFAAPVASPPSAEPRPEPPPPRPPLPKPPTPTDLLGRPVVNLDTPELQRFLAGKRVMVTGAGGSIGSEICRQAMRFCPGRILLVERAENALFEIDRELRETWIGAEVRPYLADVCERVRIEQIFRDERPHVVFHCAAHKHVPMMEANPCEAVNPTSVMGATKRVAELYVQAMSRTAATAHEKIRVWHLPPADPVEVGRGLELSSESVHSPERAVAALVACVPEYQPAGGRWPRPPWRARRCCGSCCRSTIRRAAGRRPRRREIASASPKGGFSVVGRSMRSQPMPFRSSRAWRFTAWGFSGTAQHWATAYLIHSGLAPT